MTLNDTNIALTEIRKYKKLANFIIFGKEKFCKKYKITGMQANFLIAVIAAERIEQTSI